MMARSIVNASLCPAAAAMMAQFMRTPPRKAVPDAAPRVSGECTRKRLFDVSTATTPPRDCKSSSSSSSPSELSRTPRVQPKLTLKVGVGTVALAHNKSVGGASGWLSTFILNRWGSRSGDPSFGSLKLHVLRSIKIAELEASTGEVLMRPGRRKVLGGSRCRVVNPKERVRLASRARQYKNTCMPELGYELYQWWLDHAALRQARVPTFMILAEGNLMIKRCPGACKHGAREGQHYCRL